MTEGTPRSKPGLAGYYNADLRGLAREVRQQLRDADRDRDVASATILSRGPVGDVLRADGAVVVIKGGNYVELFMQWAERNGLLTRGKRIVDLSLDEGQSRRRSVESDGALRRRAIQSDR